MIYLSSTAPCRDAIYWLLAKFCRFTNARNKFQNSGMIAYLEDNKIKQNSSDIIVMSAASRESNRFPNKGFG